MLLAFLSLTCGLILETVTRGRREIKRMQYLRVPAPGNRPRSVDTGTGGGTGVGAGTAL
jgi:hypothetical protein